MNSLELIFWIALALFCYTHVAYPALMVIVAGLRHRRLHFATKLPRVSVIIPAHNEEVIIAEKIENVLALDYPQELLEVIVANDASDDRTSEIVKAFESRVNILDFTERRGKASTVSDAASVATGEVLCFCDANVMFQPDAIRCMIHRLNDESVGAVSGDVRLASDESSFGAGESLFYQIERAVQYGESCTGSMMGVDGGMFVIRKEFFKPLRADTILDDFVISIQVLRQGKRVVYEPSAVANENGTPSALEEFRRRIRVSAGASQSFKRGQWPPLLRPVELWQYVSHKLLRWCGPALLLILLVTSSLLWWDGSSYRIALGGQLAVYAAALIGAVYADARQISLVGIPFYFTMSHVAMSIGLVKGMFDRQEVTWSRTKRESSAAQESKLQLSQKT